jgi:hypothetical protein
LRLFDVLRGTFGVGRRLRTVKFASSVEKRRRGKARFLVSYRRSPSRDLTESSEIRNLRFATVVTSDAVAPVDGSPREKRVFGKIIVE